MSDGLNPVVTRFIEDAGSTTQSLGVGRVIGQIYAYLYFSEKPRSLAEMQADLGISKGSASMGVRQLEQWHAVRKVWVKGDRKDYYEASDWFGRIVKSILVDTVGKKLMGYTAFLDEAESMLDSRGDANGAFIRGRVKQLRKFHGRAQRLWGSGAVRMLLR